MKLAISGTYCTGKTTTSIALAHLTGIPRTHAKTMREILPEAFPGKTLEECTGPELFELGIRRYVERAVHESHLPDGFVSDGSSLHEWVYGTVRMSVGIHPDDGEPKPEAIAQARLFAEVIKHFGAVVKQHASRTYDAFVHLPVEFPLVADGHRPVSERFRQLSDQMLRDTLAELGIPHQVVGGTIPQRLTRIVELYDLPTVCGVDEAIAAAQAELARLDTAGELDRTPALAT
jgi:hypothetical protein